MEAGYKQTEVGVIPEDWEITKVIDVCDLVVDCKNRTPPVMENGDYAVVRTPNVRAGKFVKEGLRFTDYISFLEWTKRGVPQQGDVLITREAPLGEVCLVPPGYRVCLGQRMMMYRPNQYKCNSQFLLYILMSSSVQNNLQKKIGGSTVGHAKVDDIRYLVIPLPPTKTEQTAIANALSDADAWIQSLTRLIAKKRQIKQGAMQTLLNPYENGRLKAGWVVKQLGDIAHVEMGQSPSSKNYNYKAHGLPLIQGNADIKKRKTIVRAYTSEVTKKCNSGDILMSVRAPVGEISVAIFNACIGRGVCAIRYSNDYLFYFLISLERSWGKLSKGSTFDSVNSTEVKGLTIYLPKKVNEQTRIATILSDIDNEITALETKLAKAKNIKQGMMQNLLTGRIRLI